MSNLDALRARVASLEKMLTAASHALRSYQFGNASTELAQSVADAADAALLAALPASTQEMNDG